MNDYLPIVLTGLPGAGKSRVGQRLAQILNVAHIDIDDIVEREEGTSIAEIFSNSGESTFRDLERNAITEALRKPAVISLGGGAVETPAVREALRDALVIWIDASSEELLERVQRNRLRPLLQENAKGTLERLRQRRYGYYDELATLKVTSTEAPVDDVIFTIFRRLWGIDVVVVKGNPDYFVFIGSNAKRFLQNIVPGNSSKFVVISDERVIVPRDLTQVLQAQGPALHTLALPSGEQAKNITVVEDAWDKLGQWQVGRKDTVISVGGGATTDVVGFIGATWLRGIYICHCPTSLLAMVDAAVGGKTGINSPSGKNLIGSFYNPIGVIADLDFLQTLGEREFRAGLAEIIKCGLIVDREILTIVKDNPQLANRDWALSKGIDVLQEIITRSVRVKAQIVAEDMHESGLREILNFGHTLAHGLEKASNYQLLHGEAVALGCIFAVRLAEDMGLSGADTTHLVVSLFDQMRLPTTVDGDARTLLSYMSSDKKARGNQMRFVLLKDGETPTTQPVDEQTVLDVLERFLN